MQKGCHLIRESNLYIMGVSNLYQLSISNMTKMYMVYSFNYDHL